MIAGLYTRVSTEDQVENGLSLEFQKRRLTEYCIQNNIQIHKLYSDEGISGTKFEERTALQSLLLACKNKEIDEVIVMKTDRLSRDLYILLTIKTTLDSYGIKLIITDEAVNPNDDTGMVMFSMLGVFAQFEHRKITERLLAGKREAAKKGIKVRYGSSMPFGYRYDEITKRYEPNEDAYIVRMMFEMFCNGKSYHAISKYIIENVKKINYTQVDRVIRNPIYKGYVGFNWFTDNVAHIKRNTNDDSFCVKSINITPIVSEEIWDKANARITYTKKVKKPVNDEFYLIDVLYCAGCGYKMRSRTTTSIRKYYCCSSHDKRFRHKIACETTNSVRCEELHSQFANFLKSIKITQVKKKAIKNDSQALEQDIKATQTAINKKNTQKSTLLEKLSLGIIADNDYLVMNNRLVQDIEELNKTLEILKQKQALMTDIEEYQQNLEENIIKLKNIAVLWDGLSDTKKREIIYSTIQRIEVKDKKIVKIEFKSQ